MHRGAAGADESTGDGAGILLQMPHEFFAAEAERLGFALPAPKQYGVAMLFLPQDADSAAGASRSSPRRSTAKGLKMLGWRDVPYRQPLPGRHGPGGRAGHPAGRLSVAEGREDEDLERRLYVVRKRIERRVRRTLGDAADEFYIPSMSCRTIVYKGMFLAPQLFAYYPDLADRADAHGPGDRPPAVQHQHVSELAAGPAVPHDRPQRRDQHACAATPTGCRATRRRWPARRWATTCRSCSRSCQPGGSDSACFDNAHGTAGPRRPFGARTP